jgi:glutamine amidotransferase-like uncharacterized protein
LLLGLTLILNFNSVAAAQNSNNTTQSSFSTNSQLNTTQHKLVTTIKSSSYITSTKTIKVLIYNGKGTGTTYVNGIISVLYAANTKNLVPGYRFSYTTSKTVTSKILSNYDLLAMPGGTSGKMYIDTIGASVIRNFVSSGHGYLGICAGAYAGSSYVNGLYNAWGVAPNVRCKAATHTGNLRITMTTSGSQFLSTSGTITLAYSNGPAMYQYGGSIITFATYTDKTNGYQKYGAIVGDTFGKGRSILIGPHSELTPQNPFLLIKMIIWAANLQSVPLNSFTTIQINSASKSVYTYFGTYHKLPSKITVSNKQVTTSQFLPLLTTDLLNIHTGSKSPITLKSVSSPNTGADTYKTGNITETEYLIIATRINSYINTYKTAPSYFSSSLGSIKFESIIYMYSRIMTYYFTYNKLPGYVTMTNNT